MKRNSMEAIIRAQENMSKLLSGIIPHLEAMQRAANMANSPGYKAAFGMMNSPAYQATIDNIPMINAAAQLARATMPMRQAYENLNIDRMIGFQNAISQVPAFSQLQDSINAIQNVWSKIDFDFPAFRAELLDIPFDSDIVDIEELPNEDKEALQDDFAPFNAELQEIMLDTEKPNWQQRFMDFLKKWAHKNPLITAIIITFIIPIFVTHCSEQIPDTKPNEPISIIVNIESQQTDKLPRVIFDSVSDNIKKLESLFPSAVKDGQLDIDALKEELGQFEEVGKEKYELTWAGKQNAKKLAQEDVAGRTLKFVPKDSKSADTTQNLYIEGDNLEVLKLLRQNYYGAVKMIYIDPPYNTGNDFVYRDDFLQSKAESDEAEGETVDGERMVVNQKSGNRYHANWLNMMYPRLKVAKDLLREDGVIFISIDDIEVDNLKKLCSEIFGEDNFTADLIWQSTAGSNTGTDIVTVTEHILVYTKVRNVFMFDGKLSDEQSYTLSDRYESERGKYSLDKLDRRRVAGHYSQALDYPIEMPDGSLRYPGGGSEKSAEGWNYLWSKTKIEWGLAEGFIEFKKNENGWNVYNKRYAKIDNEGNLVERSTPFRNLITSDQYNTAQGTSELRSLFDFRPFDFPKPSGLIKYVLTTAVRQNKEALILDFFSGSASTAHAVMQLNAEDGGNRRFIMVQYPEACDENSEAANAGYANICEIGKERIRRAGEKIKTEIESSNAQLKIGEEPKQVPDIGFRVFRTADTNIRWTHEAVMGQMEVDENMLSDKDRLDFMPGYSDIDVVYEVLLRQRDIPLSADNEKLNIGKRTYMFADAYVVCLDDSVDAELVEALAAVEPTPIKYVLRDSAFDDNISLKDETIRRLEAYIARNSGEQKKAYTVEFI